MNEQKKQQRTQPKNSQQLMVRESEDKARSYLSSVSDSLQDVALRKYDQNSFIKSAMLAIASDWKLQKALDSDNGRVSLYRALQRGAASGLSLNPDDGYACLVAYEDKHGNMIVRHQIMKNGVCKLAIDTGKVKAIIGDAVHENDDFKITKTLEGDEFIFSPAVQDRGDYIGFFAACIFEENGTRTNRVAYMTLKQICEHRDKHATSLKLGDKSAWVKSFEGMAVKTVTKRLFNRLMFDDGKSEIDIVPLCADDDDRGFGPADVTKDIEQQKQRTIQVEAEQSKPDSVF
jgi:phage RecT family recombinase